MITLTLENQLYLVTFWLAFSRWITILIQLPQFDHVSIPFQVKVLTALLLTYTFMPLVSNEIIKDIQFIGQDRFWTLTIGYSLIGLTTGFFVKAIMLLFYSAGAIITQQVGFGAVRFFDPSSAQQVGPFEKLIHITMLVMIISSGALLPMLKGIIASFNSIHLYNLGKFGSSPLYYFNLFKSLFISALLLASPLIFTNLLIMSVLGVIAKTVPQMNVIMVSFIVNIAVGLIVFSAAGQEFFQVAFKMYTEELGKWFQFVT